MEVLYACTLLTAAAPLVAPNAIANTVTGVVDPTIIGQMNCDAGVSVTYRFERPPQLEQPPVLGDGSGYRYSLARVRDVDITTVEGWNTATALTIEDARNMPLESVGEQISKANGVVSFSGLSRGLYLVEVETPEGLGANDGNVAPFLLTLPTGQGGSWRCDSEVHPKRVPEIGTPPTVPPLTPPGGNTPPPKETPITTPVTPQQTPPSGSETPVSPAGHVPPNSRPPIVPNLANTGASVIAVVIAGIGLVLAGVLLVRGRRTTDLPARQELRNF